MIKVNFIEVGRGKKSWTASCTEITFDWLCKQVLLFVPIKDIAEGLSFKNVHGKGTIYAGVRSVGKFEVVTETITNEGSGDNAEG